VRLGEGGLTWVLASRRMPRHGRGLLSVLSVSCLLVSAGLGVAGPGALARPVHGAKHHKRKHHKKRHHAASVPTASPTKPGSYFTLSGEVSATISDSGPADCPGQGISGAGATPGAELVTTGITQFGTFTLPDAQLVQVIEVVYSPSALPEGYTGQPSTYYSWGSFGAPSGATGTITLAQLPNKLGVKGSLDLTLEPSDYSSFDNPEQNEATSEEAIKGTWYCPG